MTSDTFRIGCGAGMSDDRIPPAVELAERGRLDVMVLECLAERTIARETLDRERDPTLGYTPTLAARMAAVMPPCRTSGTRIVTNMGAANPMAAAAVVGREADRLGLGPVHCAVVTGDEVTDLVRTMPALCAMEDGVPLEAILPRMASANAYLGAEAVRDGLATGADIVITGRVADPSLFLGAIMHRFGWAGDDWPRIAAGTVTGHLLECSAQLTGGCFADPGRKEVERLAEVGYPIAEVTAAGAVTLSKTPGSGGRLDRATCTEQLLYEIHDPAAYVTPDCVLDVTELDFHERGKDVVAVTGARATPPTDTLKVVVGYRDGFIGTGETSFAGINAVARARLGAEVVKDRLRLRGFTYQEMRVDLIGIGSLHGEAPDRPEPYEVRLRIAARTQDRKAAAAVGAEVRSLHMQGPSGAGGGINLGVQEVLAVKSVLLPCHLVRHAVRSIMA